MRAREVEARQRRMLRVTVVHAAARALKDGHVMKQQLPLEHVRVRGATMRGRWWNREG